MRLGRKEAETSIASLKQRRKKTAWDPPSASYPKGLLIHRCHCKDTACPEGSLRAPPPSLPL